MPDLSDFYFSRIFKPGSLNEIIALPGFTFNKYYYSGEIF
jgi:hypothetical protein